MLTVVLAAAQGLVLGYLAGRLRPGRWLFDRAYDFATTDHRRRSAAWFAAEAVSAVMLAGALLTRPHLTVCRIRDARRLDGGRDRLEPAPRIDPHWGRR